MRIIITGGHLAPALAVIDELQKRGERVVFIGRKYNLASEKSISLEYKEITKRRILFYSIISAKLTRIASLKTLINLIKFPIGVIQAYRIIHKEKPDLLLSFGGYIALHVTVASFIIGIPIYTHEQTIRPGLANKLIGYFAKKIFISFPQSGKYFSQKKIIVSGNPVKKSIFKIIKKPFIIKKKRPLIYVTGGSLGSHSINLHIKNILPQLLKKYIVIHQVGNVKNYHDFETLQNIKKKLPEKLKQNYFLVKHFYEDEIGYIYSLTDLVIGRAGANTFFELIFLKKPTIFIPLPWSANKEQQKQAEIFKKMEVGEIFLQKDNSEKLLLLIDKVTKNLNFYKDNFKNLPVKHREDAVKTILAKIK